MAIKKECPACGLEFFNVSAHMRAKHPDWKKPEPEPPAPAETAPPAEDPAPGFTMQHGDVFENRDKSFMVCVSVQTEECGFARHRNFTKLKSTPFHLLVERAKTVKVSLCEHNINAGVWRFVANVSGNWK